MQPLDLFFFFFLSVVSFERFVLGFLRLEFSGLSLDFGVHERYFIRFCLCLEGLF